MEFVQAICRRGAFRRVVDFNAKTKIQGSRPQAFPESVNPQNCVAKTPDEMVRELFEKKPGLGQRFRRRLLWRYPHFRLQMRLERLFR